MIKEKKLLKFSSIHIATYNNKGYCRISNKVYLVKNKFLSLYLQLSDEHYSKLAE